MVRMIKVNSTNLSAVGYDSETKILTIEFNDGGLYEYYDVPQNVFDGLMSDSSKGSFFHRFIRDTYRTVKIR